MKRSRLLFRCRSRQASKPSAVFATYSSPVFAGEGDHVKHGGGVNGSACANAPPPPFGWSPSPRHRGEDKSAKLIRNSPPASSAPCRQPDRDRWHGPDAPTESPAAFRG